MKKILLLISFISQFNAFSQNINNQKNTEFAFVFSGFEPLNPIEFNNITINSRLNIQGKEGTNIKVKFDGNSYEYKIPEEGFLILEENFPMITDKKSKKTIISIKSDNDIFVNTEREILSNANNFELIPISKWGKEYTIISFKTNPENKFATPKNNFIEIIASENNTKISIKNSKGKHVESAVLNHMGNYEFLSKNDLTGYTVTADKKIGVISGNACLSTSSYCDHVAVMLNDNSKLSKKYYNPSTVVFNAINRVVAAHNNTSVHINGEYITSLKKGEFYEYINTSTPTLIESSKPVIVYFIWDSEHDSNPKNSINPAMILLPSAENAINSTTFSFPQTMIYSKNIQVIMKTSRISDLLVDGKSKNSNWNHFPSDSTISYTTLSFSDIKKHTITSTKSDSYFIPLMLAHGIDISLGNTIGKGDNNIDTEEVIEEEKIEKKLNKDSSIKVKNSEITLFVFDNDKEDGDKISIYLNEELVAKNVEVKKIGKELKLSLKQGKNTLRIKAENEGTFSPNTAGLSFDDGNSKQTLILNNKKGKSKSLKIMTN